MHCSLRRALSLGSVDGGTHKTIGREKRSLVVGHSEYGLLITPDDLPRARISSLSGFVQARSLRQCSIRLEFHEFLFEWTASLNMVAHNAPILLR
jgi:hypothetical protein